MAYNSGIFGTIIRIWNWFTGKTPKPDAGALKRLRDPEFQQRALNGAECATLAAELLEVAGSGIGGILSLSPPQGGATVKHPTSFGRLAESGHHQVFTDGNFVFDPLYSTVPIPRPEYGALIQNLNGPTVEISFFPASH